MVRVLIVDDSPTARASLRRMIVEDPDLEVIGDAATGERALEKVERLRPDIITMDVRLGDEDGVDVAAEIMMTRATPILIVTAVDNDSSLAFRALQAGALDVLPKPRSSGLDGEVGAERLRKLLNTLASVPVVTRRRRPRSSEPPKNTGGEHQPLVLIGASTGGPALLRSLLSGVPAPLSAPIVVAQHISDGFSDGFAEWLGLSTGHDVVVCTKMQRLQRGRVYLAPDEMHLSIATPTLVGPVVDESQLHRPSIDLLFESAAVRAPERTLAFLLTGMGRDGAQGLAALEQAGARTVAQSPATCVVPGMPNAAIQMGAAQEVLRPAGIQALLSALGRRESGCESVRSTGSGHPYRN